MKQNKKWILAASLSAFFCSASLAMTLGEMRVRSMPGEPFNAIVPVIDTPRKLKFIDIDLGTEQEFSEALIGYDDELDELKFQAYRESDGKVYINITTDEPLEEEILHFLLAVKSADSRVLREYVVIEEDEIFVAHAQPAVITKFKKEPTHIAVTFETEENDELEIYFEESEIQTEIVLEEQARYKVKSGDTLWSIAKHHMQGQNHKNFYQVLAALQELNPKAFIGNNINQLRTGVTLDIPTMTQISEMDLRDATQEVIAQLIAFEKPVVKSGLTEEKTAVEQTENQEQLRILTPTSEPSEEVVTSASEKSETEILRENLALTNESLSQVQRNNEAAQQRIDALEKQIATLREIVNLREQQANKQQEEKLASKNNGNAESTPDVSVASFENGMSDLWETITTPQWAKYLGVSVLGLIVLLILLNVLRRRRQSQDYEDKKVAKRNDDVSGQSPNADDNQASQAEFYHEINENEDMSIKLELAQAYYDIGDVAGARVLLQEVIRHGNLNQRHAAEALSAKIEMESRKK